MQLGSVHFNILNNQEEKNLVFSSNKEIINNERKKTFTGSFIDLQDKKLDNEALFKLSIDLNKELVLKDKYLNKQFITKEKDHSFKTHHS